MCGTRENCRSLPRELFQAVNGLVMQHFSYQLCSISDIEVMIYAEIARCIKSMQIN
jgi:hypothetical protein